MEQRDSVHLFLVGKDYHLGDLLWLTAVLAQYRREVTAGRILVGCPDRPISRILENNPVIDEVLCGDASTVLDLARNRHGSQCVLHDLRILPLAVTMMRQWRYRLPWLYYRDLWLAGRGQWLATYLRIGALRNFRPILGLLEEDYKVARTLPDRYVALAPHVGQYSFPVAGTFWRRVKGWGSANWIELARLLRKNGYEPVTLSGTGQPAVPGTTSLSGLPLRQIGGVIDQAAALISVESGLWFIAAARDTPFVIVPWWLPRSVNWPESMKVPHRLVYGRTTPAADVLSHALAMSQQATVQDHL